MNLAFPLTREPRHEARMRDVLRACVAHLTERVGPPVLRAVVLTGSFARGEGTVFARGTRLKVLGDLEFFVVVDGSLDARRLSRACRAWALEASARLHHRGVSADVEFGPIELDFFARKARPSIFVHDLRQHGKVLWGDERVVERIPPFGTEAIPREDAVWLLFNRIVEQLEAWDRVERVEGDRLLDLAYQRLKLSLDLAGSALAFVGAHVSLYRARPAAFGRLVTETPSLAAVLPPNFALEVARAARAKLDPGEHFGAFLAEPPEDQRQRLRRRMVAAVPAVAALLAWELRELLGAAAGAASVQALPGLLDRLTRAPRLARRLRDWAKLVINPLPAPLPIAHARVARLALATTPRALLYAGAAHAYLALGGLADERAVAARLDRTLPVPADARPRDGASARRAVVALWKWCVRNA